MVTTVKTKRGNVCPNSKCIEIYNPPLYYCSVNSRVIFKKACSIDDYEECPDKSKEREKV